jgi:hypothetical protein
LGRFGDHRINTMPLPGPIGKFHAQGVGTVYFALVPMTASGRYRSRLLPWNSALSFT